MSTPAQTESEAALRSETELLQNVASLNAGLQSLADSFSMEMEGAYQRIQNLELHVAQMHTVLKRVIEAASDERRDADWWKHNGRHPDA